MFDDDILLSSSSIVLFSILESHYYPLSVSGSRSPTIQLTTCKVPSHIVPILTSTVIEFHRSGLKNRVTNLLSSGGFMPLQPGRQVVGQLHLLQLLPLPPHLLDANASLDLFLISQSVSQQHCLMLVIHPS